MTNPHKHLDVLVLWLNDTTVELQYKHPGDYHWIDQSGSQNPITLPEYEWRIKPELKPDVVRYIHITKERSVDIASYFPSAWAGAVLEVTLDGETGEIKQSKKYQGIFND